MSAPLATLLQPCGPVLDAAAAERVREAVAGAAAADGWSDALDLAWPALAPMFGASPYLAAIPRRRAEALARALVASPDARLAALLHDIAAAAHAESSEAAAKTLRGLKADAHLAIALADLGGVWSLDQVTSAMTAFADAALQDALTAAVRSEAARGRLPAPEDAADPAPGLFVLAMGKHGAGELNYSSDIDISFFFDPDVFQAASGEPQAAAVRLTQLVSSLLNERTAEGYVFRTDLRLRPDPGATPVAVPVPAALTYYETVGQNWERAAFIKARCAAGDAAAGEAFLRALDPFVWRRSLDHAAIADIQSIKRQIHAHKVDDRLRAGGHDLKLGRGGIREIEFFVQTQQLIFGGRDAALRSSRTVEGLQALAASDHVTAETAADLTSAYARLRALEHRVQMLHDQQTHRLPEADAERRRVAALSGHDTLRRFDATVTRTLRLVNLRYAELFADEEPLSSPFGSLVFTGVENDPETLATLERMGFSREAQVSDLIRGWHHGRIPATRTAAGRELFTRLAPRLLEAARRSGTPDAAFNRFADFFTRLSGGVQVQSLFLAEPELFEMVVQVMAFAPDLGRTLARQPGALDALFDPSFFAPVREYSGVTDTIQKVAAEAGTFEAAMDAVRRIHREQAFRVGVQVLTGAAAAGEAGEAYADLADACLRALAPVALRETERAAGEFPGAVAVVALGKCGSREMTARSDIDLMAVYAPDEAGAASALKGWGAETFYGRFTQRLVTALSAPTAEGALYPVDLQLRPSGAAGPVAVSLAALEHYYAGDAETWEFMALTRARVVWASRPDMSARTAAAIETALRRPRDPLQTTRDVQAMRELMAAERPASGFWDLKLSEGGLVDAEFAAQLLQLRHAATGGPLRQGTLAALDAAEEAQLAPVRSIDALRKAWRVQQDLSQLLRVALPDGGDPAPEPDPFKARLARAGGARTYAALEARVARLRAAARKAYEGLLTDDGTAELGRSRNRGATMSQASEYEE